MGSVITTFEGKILDGQHRYAAAQAVEHDDDGAVIEAQYVEYTGDDPLGFVVAANVNRRKMGMKAKKAVFMAWRPEHGKLAQGRPGGKPVNVGFSQPDCARLFDVSVKTIERWDDELAGKPEAEENPRPKTIKRIKNSLKFIIDQLKDESLAITADELPLGDEPLLLFKVRDWLDAKKKRVAVAAE
jgi:hypothetical protein